MAVKTAKLRDTVKVPTTKMCTCCHQVRNISDFYSNRDWTEQLGKDAWCKSCAGKCVTKDELRKYFWENNREWSDKLWENAYRKAELAASKNKVYQKTTDERRASILERLTCQNVLKSMQLSYQFVDHSKDLNVNSYEDAKQAGKIIDITPIVGEPDPNIKTYSAEFNGDFKPAELKYLERFYAGLEEGFELTDISLRDNAKKLAKASLLVDKVQNDYMAGRCDFSVVKDAVAQYDLLMKTGNFAACKRKPGEKAGLNNWAETTMYLETNGHPCIKKIEWKKDVVDLAIENLGYIIESMRDENVGDAT